MKIQEQAEKVDAMLKQVAERADAVTGGKPDEGNVARNKLLAERLQKAHRVLAGIPLEKLAQLVGDYLQQKGVTKGDAEMLFKLLVKDVGFLEYAGAKSEEAAAPDMEKQRADSVEMLMGSMQEGMGGMGGMGGAR